MRVIIAARLSKATEGDGQTGLDTQERNVRAWALARGYEVVAVVADRKSGTVAPWNRKNLRPWVTDPARLGRYDAVVAYRFDRLSRGCDADTDAIKAWARQHGKQLLTEDGLVFPCEGTDGIRWDLAARMAHDEWLKIQERTTRGKLAVLAAGGLICALPWGYVSTGVKGSHGIAATDQCRDIMPQVFGKITAGESLATVCRWLESEGIPAPGNGQARTGWWPRSLGEMIRNRTYAGRHDQAMTGLDGHVHSRTLRCEAVVTDLDFKRAGAALDSRPKRGRVARAPSLLSGAMICGQCYGQSPMYRGGNGAYYRCTGTGCDRKGCGFMVRVAEADHAAQDLLSDFDGNIMDRVLVPGQGWQAEIAQTVADIRDLDPEADDYADRHGALMAALADYRGRDSTADEWRLVDTGRSYSGAFLDLMAAGDVAGARKLLTDGRKLVARRGTAGLVLDFEPESALAA